MYDLMVGSSYDLESLHFRVSAYNVFLLQWMVEHFRHFGRVRCAIYDNIEDNINFITIIYFTVNDDVSMIAI